MNSVLSRANTIFAFTLSVLAFLTFSCFLTTSFNTNAANVVVETSDHIVKSLFTPYGERSDRGYFALSLQTDLEPIFNWNVKQLFLYLTAEYKTKANRLNQVVLWDKIIPRGAKSNLHLKTIKIKYPFYDDGNFLKGNENVTLTLSWNVIPNAGLLPRIGGSGSTIVSFPNKYNQ
ncbi:signal peptidase complex subunit 3-like [Apostichopus japonicus]|uniref:signal peptidase complex subunit 3-like n=1 Tax=Stichopus japonicus TaxID=307972 RepID=UPI003AB87E04